MGLLGPLFLLLGCLVPLQCDGFCFVLIDFFVIFWLLSLRKLLFSDGRKKGNGPSGRGGKEKLGGVEGGDTVVRIYCIRKELFSLKEKKTTVNKRKSSTLSCGTLVTQGRV